MAAFQSILLTKGFNISSSDLLQICGWKFNVSLFPPSWDSGVKMTFSLWVWTVHRALEWGGHEDNLICVHWNPTYDTFLESLWPWEYSGSVFGPFGHHQDDQEAQECPPNGDLEDFGCLDVDFGIIRTMGTLRKVFWAFWSPSGGSGSSGMSSKWWFGWFGCLYGDCVTVILHMIPFWNP